MNKYALVTGGAIRVGKAICENLAGEGYNIVLVYNRSVDQAKETKKEIEKKGVKCVLYRCDIGNSKKLNAVFDKIFSEIKNINLLINNASIFEKARFEETTEDIFDRHFDINFKAPFFITQKYYEYCGKKKIEGHAVNILDSYISTNAGGHFIYLQTKKALHDFTMQAAKNLGPRLRINSVSIGLMLSSLAFDEDQVRVKSAEMPMKRKSDVSDVLRAISYLDNSKNITGVNIFVDSGHHLM